jgi:hypothetical protein
LMDPNYISIHARLYTVTRSGEQQLRKEIVRLVDIGVLEDYYSSEWDYVFPILEIPKKNIIIRVFTNFSKLSLLLQRQ